MKHVLKYLISSVRSSYSHPDLLVIQHPTHFFRSHRSSTLDFDFLSHYRYIKAIMLYEGKTWQDSGILWKTLAYSSIVWHTLAYTDILWHTLAYYGILWHTLVQHGATWCKMVQHGATWCNMVQHGATWCNICLLYTSPSPRDRG